MTTVFAEVTPQQLADACGRDPGWVCRNVLDATGSETVAELAGWLVGPPLRILLIVLVAVVANHLARRGIKRSLRRMAAGDRGRLRSRLRKATPAVLLETEETSLRTEQRIIALSTVLRSVASFGIFTIAAFMVLGELGVNLAPLLAGAGILGIALGFGSQALVRDFLSGIFILVEDQYGVGDVVDLDGTQGTVEGVSLRITTLRSVDGVLWHVPNGELRRVGNMSKHWARALLDVDVSYATDVDHARAVIKRVADEVWREQDAVLDEPEVWGVEALGPSAVTIRLVVKTIPARQWEVSRVLRERIKAAFDEDGIEIPFPQQVVWHRDALPPEARGSVADAAPDE